MKKFNRFGYVYSLIRKKHPTGLTRDLLVVLYMR